MDLDLDNLTDDFDALLDEIQEHEPIPNSPEHLTIPSPRKKVYEKMDEKDELSVWIRKHWQQGSKVEVYSVFLRKWFKGTIKRIFSDDGVRWLEIQYLAENAKRTKHVARDDFESVRPLSSAMMLHQYIFAAINAHQKGAVNSELVKYMDGETKQKIASSMKQINKLCQDIKSTDAATKREISEKMQQINQLCKDIQKII